MARKTFVHNILDEFFDITDYKNWYNNMGFSLIVSFLSMIGTVLISFITETKYVDTFQLIMSATLLFTLIIIVGYISFYKLTRYFTFFGLITFVGLITENPDLMLVAMQILMFGLVMNLLYALSILIDIMEKKNKLKEEK